MFRINGSMGCLIIILVVILMFSLMRLVGSLVFTTPIGLVLVGYLLYRYLKNNKKQTVTSVEPEHHDFEKEEEIVDVDFEEFE